MAWWKKADEFEDIEDISTIDDPVKIEIIGRPVEQDTDSSEEFTTGNKCTNCGVNISKDVQWCPSCGFNF